MARSLLLTTGTAVSHPSGHTCSARVPGCTGSSRPWSALPISCHSPCVTVNLPFRTGGTSGTSAGATQGLAHSHNTPASQAPYTMPIPVRCHHQASLTCRSSSVQQGLHPLLPTHLGCAMAARGMLAAACSPLLHYAPPPPPDCASQTTTHLWCCWLPKGGTAAAPWD
jgi:hypothetical protein